MRVCRKGSIDYEERNGADTGEVREGKKEKSTKRVRDE